MGSSIRVTDIDREIGRRVRQWRKDRGFSQQRLAEPLGITWQQLQKYETGANRVSAGRLVEIARALGIKPARFFEDLEAA